MVEVPDPGNDWPPRPVKLPQTGDEILREVERLKGQRAQFGCFGMSLGMLVVLVLIAWLVWMLLR